MDSLAFTSTRAGRLAQTKRGYHAFVPAPLPPEIHWRTDLVAALAAAERGLARLSALVESLPAPAVITQPMTHREAVISARMDGSRVTLESVYLFQAEQANLIGRQPGACEEAQESVQLARALASNVLSGQPFTGDLAQIQALHAEMMTGVRGGFVTPGEFRRTQHWIGPTGSTLNTAHYVPPTVAAMHGALDALAAYTQGPDDLPDLVRAGLVHLQFRAIAPFLDGGGCVGRLLPLLLLKTWGLLPFPVLTLSAYFERYRMAYDALLLDVVQKGDWEAWLAFFLRGIREQAAESRWRIGHLLRIWDKYQFVVEADRNPARMRDVVDHLFIRPVLTVGQLADSLDMPFKTAADYVSKLENANILREITGFARNRVFRADAVLNALSRGR